MKLNNIVRVGRRLNIAGVLLALIVVGAIVYALVWYFALRTDSGTTATPPPVQSQGQNSQQSGQGSPTPPSSPSAPAGQSGNATGNTGTSGNTSAPGGNQSSGSPSSGNLVNTGPGNVVTLFGTVSALAAFARYRYLRHKLAH